MLQLVRQVVGGNMPCPAACVCVGGCPTARQDGCGEERSASPAPRGAHARTKPLMVAMSQPPGEEVLRENAAGAGHTSVCAWRPVHSMVS